MSNNQNIRIVAGRSNVKLAQEIAQHLNIELIQSTIMNFSNTETRTELKENIRGTDVYLVGTGSSFSENGKHYPIDVAIMELYLMIDALRGSGAKTVTLILACYPYARSDKKDQPRGTISARAIATMFYPHVDRLISVDLHSGQVQGYVPSIVPFDNLYAKNTFIDHLNNNLFAELTKEQINNKYVLVSPDAGGVKRVVAYAKTLNIQYVTLEKQRDYSKLSVVENSLLIGNPEILKDKTAIMIDDMIDTAGTMIAGAKELISHGAKNVILMATHGVLSGPALQRLNDCDIVTKVLVTNTIDQSLNFEKCSKIEVVNVSKLISQVIYRLTNGGSVSELFE